MGEGGSGLSGGERERVSIARAILLNPRILILGEATSFVDTETERQIQKALDSLIKGRTTIAIAHRLSTLSNADRIISLNRGRLEEIGTPGELMTNRGFILQAGANAVTVRTPGWCCGCIAYWTGLTRFQGRRG